MHMQLQKKNKRAHAFSLLIFHCVSLVNPDSSFLTPKKGLRWLLENLALSLWDIFLKSNNLKK